MQKSDFDAAAGPVAGHHVHVFEVQEFRRPEFEVKAEASEGPHFVGSAAEARQIVQWAKFNNPAHVDRQIDTDRANMEARDRARKA